MPVSNPNTGKCWYMPEEINRLEIIRNEILRYLENTFTVKDATEIAMENIENYDGSTSDVPFTVNPWGTSQIILNCREAREKDIYGIVDEYPDFFGIREESLEYESGSDDFPVTEESRETVLFSRSGTFPDEKLKQAPDPDTSRLTVKQAFNWYLYHTIVRLSENGTKTVGIKDAVFSLKNELFLPDDFVPPALMRIAEGSEHVSVQITVDEIQPSEGPRLIYLLARCNQNGCFAPHSFYADPLGGNAGKYFTFDRIRNLLKSAFNDLQGSTEFEAFNLSRILRSVVYTIEVKKSRELKKPMFDQAKINMLENKGIARKINGTAIVSDDVSLGRIKETMKEAVDRSSILAHNWLNSLLDLSAA